MNWLDHLTESSIARMETQRIYGVVIAVVTNNKDPQKLGRMKLRFPWLSDQEESNWTRMAVPMAGRDRGFFFLPEVNDEVLVAFEQGDPNYPYIIGALWNGKDVPPETNQDGQNDTRVIKSRSGHIVRLNDKQGAEKIEIIDKTGNNRITLDATKNTISIQSDQDIELSAPQGAIKLRANKIQIEATATTEIKSQAEMNFKTNGILNLKGTLINLN
ncbi:phage tail protein [Leptolyngbya sp. NK1-12]|uniref:Phage tail protein n=1 Tax=Leptolyngbya sp. NK1-12 TaxID=2547451 RepID=A0AA96WLK4_9CYAN|nr:phage tail protein [Leptolyngbya sp. NK1-12]